MKKTDKIKSIDPAEEYADRMTELSRNFPSKSYGSITSPCNPYGYNWELHRDMGPQKCEICTRLFSEHSPEEFAAHWDEIAARARKQARGDKPKDEK